LVRFVEHFPRATWVTVLVFFAVRWAAVTAESIPHVGFPALADDLLRSAIYFH
jgi:hypothetical protein